MFREADFEPQTRMKLSQLVTAFRLAEAGIGATFVSDRLMLAPARNLHFYKISSDISERQFYILLPKRKYVSVAARRFIEYFISAEARIL